MAKAKRKRTTSTDDDLLALQGERQQAIFNQLPDNVEVLIPMYDMYRAIDQAITPLFNVEYTREAIRRGDLDHEACRANDHACAIMRKLSQLKGMPDWWKDRYIERLVDHAFHVGCNVPEVGRALKLGAEMPVLPDESSADNHKSRARS
jgi:hypothetical protein